MGRIRSIKPEFWTSEQVVECSPNARLLFIGIWNFCDDKGRHTRSVKQLKALIFPSDDFSGDDVDKMLLELEAQNLIDCYDVETKRYFQVTGWHHQKIDKPQPAKYPAMPEGYKRPDFDDHSPNASRLVSRERIGGEGSGSDPCKISSLFPISPKIGKPKKPDFTESANRFYAAYSKKIDPKDAKARFVRLAQSGVDPEKIIIAAARYAEAHRLAGTDPKFIPAPAVWLNKGGYDSEDLPTPPKRAFNGLDPAIWRPD